MKIKLLCVILNISFWNVADYKNIYTFVTSKSLHFITEEDIESVIEGINLWEAHTSEIIKLFGEI